MCLKTFNFTFSRGVCKKLISKKKKEFLIKITTMYISLKEIFFWLCSGNAERSVVCRERVMIFYVILSFWVWHNFTCCHDLIMILSIFFFNRKIFFRRGKSTDVSENFSRKGNTITAWLHNWKTFLWYVTEIEQMRHTCGMLLEAEDKEDFRK